jgi:hypothetical protein
MSDVVQLLLLLAAVLMVLIATAVCLTVYALRRLRCAVRRSLPTLSSSLRRAGSWPDPDGALGAATTISDRATTWLLQARSWLPTRTGHVDLLRLRLRQDVDATCGAVAAGMRAGRPVEQLHFICRDLRQAANQLDLDLLLAAAEPDPARREALLNRQAERRRTLSDVCALLRRAVLVAGDPTSDPLLARIAAEVSDELEALRFRAQAYRELATGGIG